MLVETKNGNILSYNEIILSNIYTRFSVITSVANGDIYFLYFTGTCQYAVIRLVVNYQSPYVSYNNKQIVYLFIYAILPYFFQVLCPWLIHKRFSCSHHRRKRTQSLCLDLFHES
jgi:hypothetical protein